MASIVSNSRPPGGHSSSKSTPAGLAGNASRDGIVSRMWASNSYSSLDGRAASSLEPDGKSGAGYTRAERVSNQIETTHAPGRYGAPSFTTRTARCTQDPTPVRSRK
jgi:hypothetical protein